MVDGGGRHFEIYFNHRNSDATAGIYATCGTGTASKNDVQETNLPSDFTSEKIQDGVRCHDEIWCYGYNIYLHEILHWDIT